MSAQSLGTAYYRQQQLTVRRTAAAAQLLWQQVDPAALDDSWNAAGQALQQVLAGGQRQAATPADAYVAAVVAADGAMSEPGGRLAVDRFAGQAADGRALISLLYEPWIETRWRLSAGQAAPEALTGGLATLVRQVATEVADAGREATGVSIAGNRATTGYVRVLNPPSCARCAVLAGTEYAFNAGFQRHPHCDCVHLPVTRYRRGHAAMDPRDYFHSLSRAEQDRIFTAASAQAIRDGADITSVVNARRSMYTAEAYGQRLRSTYDATTRRGAFFRAERQRAIDRGLIPPSGAGFRLRSHRLLPEEIYRRAGNRAEAIAMLRRYGYLT
ncbi:hypothetical protein [Kitasatospora sp. HPMI-4]|uniref:VG15 protein n=1 Tax=Kitasatospora sp. HPMI-4 TaxID=3448443 RepID=UPI003F1D6D3C